MGKKSTPTQQDLDLGKRIVDMRKRMGYTQADLATRMRVTTPTISGYETGQADPKSGGLVQLARILSCSADYLLGLTSNPNPTAASPISDDSFETARRVDLLDDRGKGAVKALLDYEEHIRRLYGARYPRWQYRLCPALPEDSLWGSGYFCSQRRLVLQKTGAGWQVCQATLT